MGYIFQPPLSGNPFPHNTDTKPRPEVLLELDKAERAAFLNFKHCWVALEKTGATSDQLKLFEALTAWDRIYYRIQEMESVE